MKQNQDDTEKIIKCIDAILEYLVKVYQHDINETPTADNANIYVSGKVNDLKGFDFEYAHNIAHDLGYVKYIEFDDGTINEFRIKPKGLLISLGGGHQKIRQKELKELEKLKWETNVSKWQSRLWWFPFLTGGLGLIFSIIALTTKESPKPDKKLIQDVIQQKQDSHIIEEQVNPSYREAVPDSSLIQTRTDGQPNELKMKIDSAYKQP